MYKEKAYITNGGNILRSNSYGKHYFMSPQKEFIRQVSDSEFSFLSSVCIKAEIEIEGEFEKVPTWHFVKSIQVVQDNSNYRWETCNNGGDYSFHTYHDWYAAEYPNGEWKFAFVERHSTSADFSYDELEGVFQQDLGTLYLSNAVNAPHYQSQRGKYWDGEELHYTSNEVLEKIATISSFEHLWNEMFEYIPSKWEDEEKGYIKNALTFSDKKEIITRLKELGVEKIKPSKKSSRGNRGEKGVRR